MLSIGGALGATQTRKFWLFYIGERVAEQRAWTRSDTDHHTCGWGLLPSWAAYWRHCNICGQCLSNIICLISFSLLFCKLTNYWTSSHWTIYVAFVSSFTFILHNITCFVSFYTTPTVFKCLLTALPPAKYQALHTLFLTIACQLWKWATFCINVVWCFMNFKKILMNTGRFTHP